MFLKGIFEPYKEYAVLPLRAALGIIFFAHGSQKVLGWFGGHGLLATITSFSQHLGIPPFLTVLASFTEFLGGIAIFLGVCTRIAGLGISIVMLVAIFKVHISNGFFINWFCQPNMGHGIEYNVALLAMALFFIIYGAGALSIDSRFCSKMGCCDTRERDINPT